MLPVVADALKAVYRVENILVTSLRGSERHVHFHLIPQHADAEQRWRQAVEWTGGHLHEFLGYYESSSAVRNREEATVKGWTKERQRHEHALDLRPQIEQLRKQIADAHR